MEDEYEMPVKITLYRQSSIETCSSPSHLTKRSFDNTEDEKDVLPRITDITIKKHSAATERNEITKETGNSHKEHDKNEFLNTLEQKLVASSLIHSDIQDRGRKENEGELGKARTCRIIEATELKQNDPNVNNKPKSSKINKNTNQMVFIKDLEDTMKKKSKTPECGTISNTKNQATPKPIPVPRRKQGTLVENVSTSVIPKIRELTLNCENTGNIHNENDVDLIDSDKTIVFESEPELESRKFTPVSLMKALKMKNNSNVSGATDTIIENAYVSTESHRPQMASTTRPKSPKPIITKTDKEESFWDKIGTLGRKKRFKEVQEVQAEGKYAIDSPGYAPTPILPPEEYDLDENEERSLIVSKTYEDEKLQNLMQVLIDWINDELASQRIIVQDLAEDLYDGQVLQKLFEMVTGRKLDVPEVTQSEEGQKQKLAVVLAHFNKVLGYPNNISKEWNVEAIHSKNIVSILHLLVALARHFRPPVRLPENVSISVDVVQKVGGQLSHRVVREKITTEYDDVGMRCERDAFDTLFDHAPDKLQVVKKSMVTFVNKHLNKLNLEVTEIETQFHDGVYLIMLMGLLEGFFVPLYSFYATPKDNDQKVHNVSFAFELMEEVGLARPKARPEDVVNLDLKSTLRVLYNLFNKYKSLL